MAATEHPSTECSGVHPERSEGSPTIAFAPCQPERNEGSLRLRHLWTRAVALLGGLLGIAAATPARAADLPEDRAETLFHLYSGGGVNAYGPALLVRKSIADKVSLGATYYMDAVSNASVDVVTTASKYRETRHEFGLTADYAYRDVRVTLSGSTSREPDYVANAAGFDISQETFGGMTTVSLGFTRGSDTVEKTNAPEFHDIAKHWRYRLGVSQILTTRWIASVNAEAVADEGYLGNPYRSARVFGAAVPERMPRTRSSRAVKFRVVGDLGSRDAVDLGYRYFWDNWAIKAHTVDAAYRRYVFGNWLAEGYLRYHTQSGAGFYSDNAPGETTYVTRNRQLSSFSTVAGGGRMTWSLGKLRERFDTKLVGAYEYARYSFGEYTDLRTGEKYRSGAHIVQLYLTATF